MDDAGWQDDAADPDGPGAAALFGRTVTSVARLRDFVPEPTQLIRDKVLDRLDEHCVRFLAATPFVVLATADARGHCDASPRGGEPGFVHVLDAHHLLVPEVPGNRLADTLVNVIERPSLGMIGFVPGLGEFLRINGRAWVVEDADVLARAFPVKTPALGIGVAITQAYIHCAKAALRSWLWKPERWPDRAGMAPMAEVLRDHLKGGVDGTVQSMQALLDDLYDRRNL